MSEKYIPYHIHSDFSLLDSCTKFEDYVDMAVNMGLPAIASTEHGKPLGWVSKKMYCDMKGIKFIHGVEIYLTESLEEKVRDNYHTVLLARNLEGVLELNEIVSRSCDAEHFYYNNRITFEEFLNISDNIISTSACLASPLNRLEDSHPSYYALANKYTFLEVQPHNIPEQIAYNKRLIALSEKIGKPLVVGTDTHSSTKYKAECRDILLSAKNKAYGDDQLDLSFHSYYKLYNMLIEQGVFNKTSALKVIDNTNMIDEMCENFVLDTSIKYPILYEDREDDASKFEDLVYKMFQEKLELGIIPEHQREAFHVAIAEEMTIFKKLKMDGFMLSMSELLRWGQMQGLSFGTARGSVGGSRVAYVIDVIDLNPETWQTEFSRFCNEDRVEIGD